MTAGMTSKTPCPAFQDRHQNVVFMSLSSSGPLCVYLVPHSPFWPSTGTRAPRPSCLGLVCHTGRGRPEHPVMWLQPLLPGSWRCCSGRARWPGFWRSPGPNSRSEALTPPPKVRHQELTPKGTLPFRPQALPWRRRPGVTCYLNVEPGPGPLPQCGHPELRGLWAVLTGALLSHPHAGIWSQFRPLMPHS